MPGHREPSGLGLPHSLAHFDPVSQNWRGVRVAGGVSHLSHTFSGEKSSLCSVSHCLHGRAGSALSWDFLHVFLTEAIK